MILILTFALVLIAATILAMPTIVQRSQLAGFRAGLASLKVDGNEYDLRFQH